MAVNIKKFTFLQHSLDVDRSDERSSKREDYGESVSQKMRWLPNIFQSKQRVWQASVGTKLQDGKICSYLLKMVKRFSPYNGSQWHDFCYRIKHGVTISLLTLLIIHYAVQRSERSYLDAEIRENILSAAWWIHLHKRDHHKLHINSGLSYIIVNITAKTLTISTLLDLHCTV